MIFLRTTLSVLRRLPCLPLIVASGLAACQAAAPSQQVMPSQQSINKQVEDHWNVDAGAPNLDKMTIVVLVHLNPDGTVASARIAPESLAQDNSDKIFHMVAQSVLRAVYATQHITFPPEKYEAFKDLKLVFRPADML